MASAWGKSWGAAFGNAFGAAIGSVVIASAPAFIGGGGSPHYQQIEVDEQIRSEDEIIILAVAQLIVQGAFS